jgi:MutS2 family protein
LNKTAIELLEFDKIKEILKDYAVSDLGKNHIEKLEPSFKIEEIEHWLRETTEAKKIICSGSGVPLHSLKGIQNIFSKFGKGAALLPEEFSVIAGLIRDGKRLKKFLKEREFDAPLVATYGQSIAELDDVYEEIERCIRNGKVDDRASNELLKIRKKISVYDDRIKNKIDKILKSDHYKKYLQDSIVSIRDGRYVIPVKSQYRKNVKGSVIDSSSTGATVFIEPEDIRRVQDELNLLKIEDEKEVYRVLSYLMGILEDCERELKINIETMAYYDFLFAKAKLSRAIDGNTVKLNDEKYINIIKGKHPLLGKCAVPLDFMIGKDYRALVITGPNTGGKTVTLKTVGLLTMMVQSGLHVPVQEGSEFSPFIDILVDIGDGQSIEQSLSTFSSHIRNIISILEYANSNTLVIVDELGTGTDPGEGMGLAISILESVFNSRATLLATTHYSEIKEYAQEKDGFENGCMGFDINTLKPLYRLKIGASGESNAFLIALRLGMNNKIIERAHEVTYKEKKSYSAYEYKDNVKEVKNEEVKKAYDKQIEEKEKYKKLVKIREKQKKKSTFNIGDCVYISSLGGTGIVYSTENSKGEIGVIYKKKRIKVNKKRLSLYIDGKELYPEEYDMDIVLESKENRKKRHLMSRKHVEGLIIVKGKDI